MQHPMVIPAAVPVLGLRACASVLQRLYLCRAVGPTVAQHCNSCACCECVPLSS